jgi:site-specific recombinase XerD
MSQELVPVARSAAAEVTVLEPGRLPPVLLGSMTGQVEPRVERFYFRVAEFFKLWVKGKRSANTQKAYRQDVMSFVGFLGLRWPEESTAFLRVTVADVQRFRDELEDLGAAPKTINRRLSSVSSFYKYLAGVAAEERLPITVPNPAHAQFIARGSTDPVEQTKALTLNRAQQLIRLPSGDSIVSYRDRAILKFYLYTGARLGTGCKLLVSDFHQDEDGSTIRIIEKGGKRRTIGLHFVAGQAIADYIQRAELTSGPLFPRRRGPRSEKHPNRGLSENAMSAIIMGYLTQLPGAMKEEEKPDGTTEKRCIYTPHSLRATAATLLLKDKVDISAVKDLLGHRHITTTQIYDKRTITVQESASHKVPI